MLAAPTASAVPMEIDPSADASSVEININSGLCLSQSCSLSVSLSDALNAASAMLDVGDSMAFDFFTITMAGLGLITDADIMATLGFLTPEGMFASSTGSGNFFSFFGQFSGGSILWGDPQYIELADGTTLIIEFDDIAAIGWGDSATVTARIRRVAQVPEPATLALFGVGLFALAFVGRRSRAVSRASRK